MQHLESSIKIYYTKDYSIFSKITGNRIINKTKINRIKQDILGGLDVLRYCPILVQVKDGNLEIIDGQHRCEVARQMKSKVWYIIVEDFSLMDIAKINSNTEKWKTADYINCYMKQGNVSYSTLQTFLDEYVFPLSVSIRLLAHGSITRDSGLDDHESQKFKRGTFEVKYLEKATAFADKCRMFDKFSGWNSRPFILAIESILNAGKCDYIELVEMFNKDVTQLKRQSQPKEYLNNLEEIYNYRMRVRRTIY